ncbi:MAG TPA: SCO family protein [Pirellulales bacterium]|jgi:protein SCO1/2|nr:SCO family protein [Pirellulales bacterium]
MKSKALVFWLMLAVVSSAAYGSWLAWRTFHGEEPRHANTPAWQANYPPAPPAGPPIKDFKLVERSGRQFDSSELKGHVWVSSFFFASCPGPCWQQNQALKAVSEEFKNTDLRLVSITCDPKNDSPEVLSRYADRLSADPFRWVFLTGDLEYIKRIGHDVFLQYVQEGSHLNRALVIDRQGQIRNSFDLLDASKLEELKTLVRQLLDEKPAAEANPASDATDSASNAAQAP